MSEKERERNRERENRVLFTWNRATIAKGKDSSNPFTPNVVLMLFRITQNRPDKSSKQCPL